MKKTVLYIIPGYGETCSKRLIKSFFDAGFDVHPINPDWKKPLSQLVCRLSKDAIVFGFSFGAIVAHRSAVKWPCRAVILGSMTPIKKHSLRDFERHFSKIRDDYKEYARDAKSLSLGKPKVPSIRIAGDSEALDADFYIKDTDHRLTKRYLDAVIVLAKLVLDSNS